MYKEELIAICHEEHAVSLKTFFLCHCITNEIMRPAMFPCCMCNKSMDFSIQFLLVFQDNSEGGWRGCLEVSNYRVFIAETYLQLFIVFRDNTVLQSIVFRIMCACFWKDRKSVMAGTHAGVPCITVSNADILKHVF